MKIIKNKTLDKYYPPCGPCAFCGHIDKRHRLWDSIIDRNIGGETIKSLASDYNLPIVAIKHVLNIMPYRNINEYR